MTYRVAIAAFVLLASQALAQPAAVNARTGGLLIADQGVDAIYRAKDRNGDGDARDPGELTLWIADAGQGPLGNVLSIFQSASGAVYFGEGDTDSVYRAVDQNMNGSVADAGECKVWFSAAGNFEGFPLTTPSGVFEREPGVVFILNVGTASTPGDAIYRTEDLNGDGDAEDAGEATMWFDLEATGIGSSAFELAFIGERAFWTDLLGSATDEVMWAEDLDGSGSIDDGEWGTFIAANNPYGAPVGFALKTDGDSLYVAHNLASADQMVYRLTDLDHSGMIDSAAEAIELWDESELTDDQELGTVFTLAVGPGRSVALGSSGSDLADAVYRLNDVDGDGTFLSPGETGILVGSGSASGTPADRVRAVEFMLSPCRADVNGDETLDFFDVSRFLEWFSASDPAADINHDGTFDFFDALGYLNLFADGCG